MSSEIEDQQKTKTGGRPASTGVIEGRYALSVGMPSNQHPIEGWKWTPLSSIARLESGHTPSRKHSEYWGGDIPWIGIRDATGNHGLTINETLQHTNSLGIANSSARILPKHTVCLSRTASVGYVVVMGCPMATSQDFVNWVCSDRLDHRYLKYILFCEHDSMLRFASGTTHQTIYFPEAKAFHVLIPSIEEQRRIADVLQSLDDRITLLRETNATLEAIAQALFKSWFVDFDPVRAKAEGLEPEGMDAATAALFPDSFEESELGLVPMGWTATKFGDFIDRLSVGQKYDQKSAFPEGIVPILDQGRSGIMGYHNDSPGVKASLDNPVVVFANHTCYMRLITFDFSAIQNVLPFKGRAVDTVWAFYATKDRTKFSEYKGHWPDFAIEKLPRPSEDLTRAFRKAVDPLVRKIRFSELQSQTLTQLRDTLLPRLISGQLRLLETETSVENCLSEVV